MNRFLLSLLGGVAWLATSVASAQTLSLSAEGVILDDGAGSKLTLKYPLLTNAQKKDIKIAEKRFEGSKATAKYEGGGQLDLEVQGSEIRMKFSGLPAEVKQIHTTMAIPAAYGQGGKYVIAGAEAKDFPKEKAEKPMLYQGAARSLRVISAAGGKITVNIPAYSYQQLQDNRAWGMPTLQWQMWTPYYPESGQVVLMVGEVAEKSAAKPAAKNEGIAKEASPRLAKAPSLPPLEKVSDTQVTKWKDGKSAAFLLAFDDGCRTHITNVIPELRKRNMAGTFYVIAGNGLFQDQPAWAKEAALGNVEFGNHTLNHGNIAGVAQLEEQLGRATEEINKRVPDRKPNRLISFGQPGGVKWTDISKEELKQALEKHNLVNRPPFWGAVLHVKTVADMQKLVDQTIAKEEMGHLDFHGVGGDWLPTPMDYFMATLDKLEAEKDRLWVTDHISAHKYQTERKTAEVKVVESAAKQIRLTLSMQADASLYDQPLTLRTKVPADWKQVTVTQGQAKKTAAAVDGIVLYEAMPGATEIVLQPAS